MLRFSSLSVTTVMLASSLLVAGCALDGSKSTRSAAKTGNVAQYHGAVINYDDHWRDRVGDATFTVEINNISPPDILTKPDGSPMPAGMSHVLYAVHRGESPIITPGAVVDPRSGMRALAEDGDVRPPRRYIWDNEEVLEGGIAYRNPETDKIQELMPGNSFVFTVTADPGDRLSLATMLMQSNDAVYGTDGSGIALFDSGGQPISGNVVDQVTLWDFGTEKNELGGFGPNAGMFQGKPGDGERENKPVRPIDDGYEYPAPERVLEVIVTPE